MFFQNSFKNFLKVFLKSSFNFFSKIFLIFQIHIVIIFHENIELLNNETHYPQIVILLLQFRYFGVVEIVTNGILNCIRH